MKKEMIVLMLVLLPILIFGNMTRFFAPPSDFTQRISMAGARSWRLQEQISSYMWGGDWHPYERAGLNYSPQYPQRIDSVNFYEYDEDLMQWTPSQILEHTYAHHPEYVSQSLMSYLEGSNTYPYMRNTMSYDAQMRLTQYLMEYQDIIDRQWTIWNRVDIEWLGPTTFTIHNWFVGFGGENPSWGRVDFTYDAQGRIIEEISETSPDSLNWVPDYRTTHSYHPHDTGTGASLVYNLSRLLPLMFFFQQMNIFGMVEEETEYTWDGMGWTEETMHEFTYDPQDRLIQDMESYWTMIEWEESDRRSIYYDANGNKEYEILAYFDSWDEMWIDQDRIDSTWESFVSASDDITQPVASLDLKIWPQPFSTELNIGAQSKSAEPVSIGIYNLRGQLIRSLEAAPNAVITWDGRTGNNSTAAAGFYFVRADQAGHSAIRRVLRLK